MPVEPVPALVTLHLWRVPRRRVPRALTAVALTAVAGHRRAPRDARFARMLGTSRGFTPRSADPCRWALLATWASHAQADAFERSAAARRWDRLADERWRVGLRPLACRGRWSGRAPFGEPASERSAAAPDGTSDGTSEGAVAALTRARLVPRKWVTFWRATPPVAAALRDAPGLRLALGIGEAPVALQGTFSVWESAAALRSYAYGSPAHLAAVR
ncbi:MAG: monooxygenase, partial [Mycobacterium leprae]